MSNYESVHIDSTSRIEVTVEDDTGAPTDTATVTLENIFSDRTGSSVSGLSYPLTFSSVGSGVYTLKVSPASLRENDVYVFVLKAVNGSDTSVWHESRTARYQPN